MMLQGQQEKQVVNMMMILLAKIAKLAWFDDPVIKTGLVPELTKIIQIKENPIHQLIGLRSLNELLNEMTYMTKMKNLTINRRISLNFRDTCLGSIFSINIKFLNSLVQRLTNMAKDGGG